jgi:26S proteasome subunit RPN2, N-terminal domain
LAFISLFQIFAVTSRSHSFSSLPFSFLLIVFLPFSGYLTPKTNTRIMTQVMLTSAAGVLSLLQEPDDALKAHALQKVNDLVDQFWAEIASSIATMYVYLVLCKQAMFVVVILHMLSFVYWHLLLPDDSSLTLFLLSLLSTCVVVVAVLFSFVSLFIFSSLLFSSPPHPSFVYFPLQ